VRQKLWKNLQGFRESANIWFNKAFREQDANEIVNKIKDFERENLQLRAQLPRDVPDQVLETLRNEVKDVAIYGNLIVALGNKALEEKHWEKIFHLIEQPKPSSLNTFNLQFLVENGILKEFERVDEISAFASGESTINTALNEISNFWANEALFTVLSYRDSKDRFIIGDVEDTIAQLEDNQMSI